MPDDTVGLLRQWAHTSSSHEQREVFAAAADEIERLRSQVAELLPFAVSDARLGASLGPHPDGDYDDCDDCTWYQDSLALLEMIDAGEFGPVAPGEEPA